MLTNHNNNIDSTSTKTLHKKVIFMIEKTCISENKDIVVSLNYDNTNNCSTCADSKPISNNNYKYQRKSQPGYKRDYNNYYKNY